MAKHETDNECTITLRTSERRRKKFKAACNKSGMRPSVVLRRMIDDYNAGNISYPVEVK